MRIYGKWELPYTKAMKLRPLRLLKRQPKDSPQRKGWHKWSGRILKIVLTLIIAVHVYALLLRFVPVPATVLIVQRALAGETIRKEWTRLEDISPYLIFSVIGAEDSWFCEHSGVDWNAVKTVMNERETGERQRGGSTITQQTAKNVFLWNGGGWVRKLPETWFALFIDTVWGKKRVIEVYLNVAEWGNGIFGAQAAAQARFGKNAKDLTPKEAALLAAVLPNPHKWRVDPPGQYVEQRAANLVVRARDVKAGQYASCVQ